MGSRTRRLGEVNRQDGNEAAACLEDDRDRCLTFHPFPEAHWLHLRTTNVIGSPFAAVRLRTHAARRFRRTQDGACLVFEVLRRLQHHGQRLKSAHLCGTVPLPAAAKKRKVHAARKLTAVS